MNSALITKSNNRILQEIQHGFKSKAYKLIIPYIGGLQSPNIVYVKFNKDSGFYAGQDHILEIKFQWGNPINHYYPFHPPLITFKTPIWHPNISSFPGGAICLDFLKQEGLWSATCTIEGLIEMIKAMMDDPNPNSPQNPDAGKSYSDSIKTKSWAMICANYYKQHIKSCEDIFTTFQIVQDEDEPPSQELKKTSESEKSENPGNPGKSNKEIKKLTSSKILYDDSDEEPVVKKVVKKDKTNTKISKNSATPSKTIYTTDILSDSSEKSDDPVSEESDSAELQESDESSEESDVPKSKKTSKVLKSSTSKISKTPKTSKTLKTLKSSKLSESKKITFKKR